MFCNQCGAPIEEGAAFCNACGAKQDIADASAVLPVSSENMIQSGKKPFARKKFVWATGILAALVIVVAAGAVLFGKCFHTAGYDKYAEAWVDYINEDSTGILYSTKGERLELDGEIYGISYSADMSVMAYIVKEDNTTDLYYVDEELEPHFIEEDVYDFMISYDGSHIAYLQDVNAEWTEADLYLYSVKKDKAVKIDKNVYPSNIVLSPNGKYISYLKNYESYSDNELFVAGYAKDSEKIDKDGSYALGVMNNGKMYYRTDNNKLYYFNGKSSVKIDSNMSGTFYFNKDLTELLYTKNSKIYYYTPKMTDAEKVYNNGIYDIAVPDNMVVETNVGGYIIGKDSLKNTVWETYNGLVWFDKTGKEMSKITSGDNSYCISEDGKSMIYVKEGKLYKTKIGSDDKPVTLYNDEYVDGIVANYDLSKIYVITEDDLYYIKNEKKSERITNDLNNGRYSVVFSNSLNKVVFIEDDNLCCADTKESSKKVLEKEVSYVDSIYGIVVYEIYDEDSYETTYFILDGEKSIELYTR